MTYKIDPITDAPVVAEFKACPIGHHSPNLQRVLNTMRLSKPKLALLCTKAFEEYVLVDVPTDRRLPMNIHWDEKFQTREAAEWDVFKRRWKMLTGQSITD